MPIRRRDDGEIIEESTEPVRGREGDCAEHGADDTSTEPVKSRKSRPQGDSLFEGGATQSWEAPTKPIGSGGDGKTRIISPRGRPQPTDAAASAPEEDLMADPPVGWLVVVRGPGKGRVLTLGNGMNPVGRSAQSRVLGLRRRQHLPRQSRPVGLRATSAALAAESRGRHQSHLPQWRSGHEHGRGPIRR